MKYFLFSIFLLCLSNTLFSKDLKKKEIAPSIQQMIDSYKLELNKIRIKDSLRYEEIVKQYEIKFQNFEKSNSHHLTSINFVLSGIGLLFSIVIVGFGIFTFAQFKKIENDLITDRNNISKKFRTYNIEYHKKKKEIDHELVNRQTKIDSSIESYSEQIANLESIQNDTYKSNMHIQNGLNFVFEISLALAENENNKKLLNNIYEYQNIAELYSINTNRKFSSLSYLQHRGTRNAIKHLEYVAKNDSELHYRDWANQIIGIITQKEKI